MYTAFARYSNVSVPKFTLKIALQVISQAEIFRVPSIYYILQYLNILKMLHMYKRNSVQISSQQKQRKTVNVRIFNSINVLSVVINL
jgi:hypothetical protein